MTADEPLMPNRPLIPSRPDEYIGSGVVASVLGVTTDTVRRWAIEGRLDSVRTVGGHRRYRMSQVQDLYKSRNRRVEGTR